MANEQAIERWASALAFATVFGGRAAREKYACSERNLNHWRHWLDTKPGLREAYERKRKLLEDVVVDEAATTPVTRPRGGRPRDRTFARAVEREVAACALRAGLPAVKTVEADFVLPSRHVVDLALTHEDGSRSLCAVSSRKHSWADGHTLGHLLLCYAGAPAGFGVRLVIFADHDAGELWERAASHVTLKVAFVNVSDLTGA